MSSDKQKVELEADSMPMPAPLLFQMKLKVGETSILHRVLYINKYIIYKSILICEAQNKAKQTINISGRQLLISAP